MRFYNLTLSDPNTGRVWQVQRNGGFGLSSSTTGSTFSSLHNGINNPGALNVTFDFPVYPFHQPQGKANIEVWGVPLLALGQAANLNGANFSLAAGMTKGLPLAKPAQAGLILTGAVFQAYGLWQGTQQQSLNLIAYPGGTSENQDIMWSWPKGTQLSAAVAQCFAQAFPQYRPKVQIGNIVAPGDDMAHYTSLTRLANHVFNMSAKYGTPTYGEQYSGVAIIIRGNAIYAYDSTVATPQAPVTQLAFEDLIGQPTWLQPFTISFKTVLRADLQVGSLVKFPPAAISPYVLLTSDAVVPGGVPARSKSIFQGSFMISEVHHFAAFRQADADSWATAFLAIPIGTGR